VVLLLNLFGELKKKRKTSVSPSDRGRDVRQEAPLKETVVLIGPQHPLLFSIVILTLHDRPLAGRSGRAVYGVGLRQLAC
jgi:hypothetical protein